MFRLLFIIFLSIEIIRASWYFKEPKICNPKQNGLFPFTGFKIYRQYKIEGYLPTSLHSISITHCDHGKPDYEKQVLTTSSIDIDWNKPFCILKPDFENKRLPKPTDKVYNLYQNNNNISKGNMILDNMSGEKPLEGASVSLKSKISEVGKNLNNLLEASVDNILEKVINGKHVQYTSKKATEHVEDIRNSDPRSSLEWESRNLVCYKMARRKKYAKRNILFYIPYTFVGGLFECPIPDNRKKEIFSAFQSGDFLKNFDFKCDHSLAKPVAPLIAQDSTKQWIDTKFNPLNPVLIQRIPYLSTASVFDMRFSTSDTPDMLRDTWASQIDVNEEYTYTDLELNVISQAIALSADYFHKTFRPLDLSGVFHDLVLLRSSNGIQNSHVAIQTFIISTFKKLSLDQKINILLSSRKAEESMLHLRKLQRTWDNLVT
ncbi:DEHA2G01848p [Debaryomyces hansenii CBS767]|jgi:hypothetical protein|uniref:DEHA2G01848p n=1 Tax=Debaryomyces hansenii (strain ATCC 36239 / CBS 767 / BCRC 21394 / JCM 1990 / NBRC 0083 / IGC 2968) TaxID=284592 RepID=Q6BJK0_DEBHA|nr:DEHA2G01848p [Debaryomyces hansenii CBS767]CAG90069.1 DEHA2G01848p [Debaryomyces hansenii CBS767]|eukprot:XP_461621.1 DEHA2G01848p [Debaryomyces hansenii CBS767]